jgi:hypothetical protein
MRKVQRCERPRPDPKYWWCWRTLCSYFNALIRVNVDVACKGFVREARGPGSNAYSRLISVIRLRLVERRRLTEPEIGTFLVDRLLYLGT